MKNMNADIRETFNWSTETFCIQFTSQSNGVQQICSTSPKNDP